MPNSASFCPNGTLWVNSSQSFHWLDTGTPATRPNSRPMPIRNSHARRPTICWYRSMNCSSGPGSRTLGAMRSAIQRFSTSSVANRTVKMAASATLAPMTPQKTSDWPRASNHSLSV